MFAIRAPGLTVSVQVFTQGTKQISMVWVAKRYLSARRSQHHLCHVLGPPPIKTTGPCQEEPGHLRQPFPV